MKFGWYIQPNWDWRAAGNFMFGGAGGALIALTAIAAWPDSPPLALGLAALAFLGAGLGLVWLEIGRPWRFMNVYFHPQTSWMTREAFVAMVVFVLALVGVLMRVPVVLAAAGLMGLVFLYCQARILHMAKGIPAWREPAIVPLIIATGLAEGTGLLIVILAIVGSVPTWAGYVLAVFVACRLGAWFNYRSKLAAAKAPPAAIAKLAEISPAVVWAGNVLPLVLIVVAATLPDIAVALAACASLLAVLSGWHVKFTIVVRAAEVQGYGVGKLKRGHPLGLKPSKT
jgi:phenylacetyl-CoA:acceptor oxidoreductase subunit 2